MTDVGERMYRWATDLFPICRSLTGNGVRQTLNYFQKLLPNLAMHEAASGTKAFDWTVPDEWNIVDAFVADESGARLIDFQRCNLHVVGYSEPVDRRMSFEELDKFLHSLPEQPDAIPYVTSYYQRRWGFCLTENQRRALRERPRTMYHVQIDSTLAPGHLSYGELIIPGASEKEILLSTYVCHPSLANNELSGPCVAAALAQWIAHDLPQRQYTYRILFLVETLGSIVYLSRHADAMKRNTIAGFVLTCLGDERAYSYVASRLGDTLADRVARHVLSWLAPNYVSYSFLDRGSDERQYCSPGIELPVCSIMRSKYGIYPEYHTSLDNLSLITPQGLQGGFEALQRCIEVLEANDIYRCAAPCEPQLGRRGLYPTLSTKHSGRKAREMMNLLAYADGAHDLVAIADRIRVPVWELAETVGQLTYHGLLVRAGHRESHERRMPSRPAANVFCHHVDRRLLSVRLVGVQIADGDSSEELSVIIDDGQVPDSAILHAHDRLVGHHQQRADLMPVYVDTTWIDTLRLRAIGIVRLKPPRPGEILLAPIDGEGRQKVISQLRAEQFRFPS